MFSWASSLFTDPDTSLLKAIHNRSLVDVKKSVENGADVNKKIRNDDDIAAANRRIFGLLDLDDENLFLEVMIRFTTPLNEAIKTQDKEIIAYLVAAGANVNMPIMNRNDAQAGFNITTPFCHAIYTGNMALFHMLLPHADLDASIAKQAFLRFKKGFKEFRPGWNILNSSIPIDQAVETNNLQLVNFLLAAGADVNQVANFTSPLLIAIKKKNVEMVKCLINGKANINMTVKVRVSYYTKFYKNTTPLIQAMDTTDINNPEIIELLLSAGADVNMPEIIDNDKFVNHTPLSLAISLKTLNPLISRFLLMPDVDINAANGVALIEAAKSGNFDLVLLMLSANPLLDQTDKMGNTALMWASNKGERKTIEMLIKSGANYHLANHKGETALALAKDSETKTFISNTIQENLLQIQYDSFIETKKSLLPKDPGNIARINCQTIMDAINFYMDHADILSFQETGIGNILMSLSKLLMTYNSEQMNPELQNKFDQAAQMNRALAAELGQDDAKEITQFFPKSNATPVHYLQTAANLFAPAAENNDDAQKTLAQARP